MELTHLARRFVGSLRPGPPRPTEDRWARQHLLATEDALWSRMWNPDRRHAVGVARRVEQALGPRATRPVVAAALLHDVGKSDCRLHTFGRVAATVAGRAVHRDAATILAWSQRPGARGRIGRYLDHPRRGGVLLVQAGSDPLTVAWAEQHHRSERDWTVPAAIGRALRDADDD